MSENYLNTGLKKVLIESLKDIFAEFKSIKQVILYGSRAKGLFRPGSDVDLAFVGDLSHQDLMTIDLMIDELLTPYTYDLSLVSDINNDELLAHIERVGLVIYPENLRDI